MKEQLIKNYDEIQVETRKYDEVILRLLKQGHRELISKVITDYISQHES